jgi:ribonuclease HI
VELKNWSHPAEAVKIIEGKENKEHTMQLYTDGSKSEHGAGSGVAIFVGKELAAQIKFKLDKKCSNNQAEHLAIFKALEATETLDITVNGPRTVAIFTDSRITIDSLKNITNHNLLIEEIRKKVPILETAKRTIELSWVKAHVGTHGNELAD